MRGDLIASEDCDREGVLGIGIWKGVIGVLWLSGRKRVSACIINFFQLFPVHRSLWSMVV